MQSFFSFIVALFLTVLLVPVAMRFAASYAPKVAAPLQGCRLRLEGGRLIFSAPDDREQMMGDSPRKRLEALAAAFEVEAAEVYGD